MTRPLGLLLLMALLLGASWQAAAGQSAPMALAGSGQGAPVALSRLTHVVAGRSLIIGGSVENRSSGPIAGLVIDATGFSPSGAATTFGTDGIPWTIPPRGKEGFAIPLPLHGELVKDYTVQVAWTRLPHTPLAAKSGAVKPAAYRSLMLSLVKVEGSVHSTLLTVSAQTGALPVSQVSVEATIQVSDALTLRLLVVTADVSPNGSVTLPLDVGLATRLELLRLRVTDVKLKGDWPE